ncbi:MAG: glycine cleavage system aminomethyltransferase GcvT [Oscillospiraceae bacterium]
MEKHTPLYSSHEALGGKLVPFAGYMLPIQYSGVIAEHMAVREAAGLFDVSHMGELLLTGPDALGNLNRILTNDFTNLQIGRVRYSPMCNENGGILDDLLVYRLAEERWLLVVNASNREKDAKWIATHLSGDVEMTDQSDETAQIALQGPKAQEILERVAKREDIPQKYYSFVENVEVGGISCLLSRTGYTGEEGFELYLKNEDAPVLWNLLLEKGEDLGLIPCGLGARDTLRLEASMPLYGHEMTEEINPLETGLGFAVKMDKDFIGREAIAAKGEPTRVRVGLCVTGRGIARGEEPIFLGEKQVGFTTSGTHAPFLGKAIAMGYVDRAHSVPGTALEVEVRGRRIPVEILPMPFYKRS